MYFDHFLLVYNSKSLPRSIPWVMSLTAKDLPHSGKWTVILHLPLIMQPTSFLAFF